MATQPPSCYFLLMDQFVSSYVCCGLCACAIKCKMRGFCGIYFFSGIIELKPILDVDSILRFDEALRTKTRNGKGETRLDSRLDSLCQTRLSRCSVRPTASLNCLVTMMGTAMQSGSTQNRIEEERNAECAHALGWCRMLSSEILRR